VVLAAIPVDMKIMNIDYFWLQAPIRNIQEMAG